MPSGGKYVAGKGTIGGAGSSLTVNQNSKNGIIDWTSFSIGQGESVQFNNGSGATLNRVTGGDLSQIAGSLTATGSLYVINPQGVVVNKSGKVLTGGSFVASSRDVSDAAFMSGGPLEFSGSSNGAVVNRGSIAAGGDAVLIGNNVRNDGALSAGGTAGMAAGSDVLLQKLGDQHLYVKAGNGNVTNAGTVSATAAELRAAGGNVYALAGNNGGAINATGTKTVDGHVWLTSDTGAVRVNGAVTARNVDGSGGQIVATGKNVTVGSTANLDASGTQGGTVLVGGDLHGGRIAAENFSKTKVATAQTVSIAQGAQIKADGTQGQGGHVVVWSDNHTVFDGAISARGAASASGGFAEVSSHKVLAFNGSADMLSQSGLTGDLLLDPENVTISADATSNGAFSGRRFKPSGDDSILNVTMLENALATANVNVTTGSAGSLGGQAGNITVLAPITWATNTLTLNAFHSISLDAAITTGGTLNLVSGGNITQSSAGIITAKTLTGSSGGTVTLTADNAIQRLGAFTTSNRAFSLTDIDALTVTGAVNANNAKLTLTTMGDHLAIDAALTGATVDLVSSGTIGQDSAGIITAKTLSGSSVGATTLIAANTIGQLGAFTTDNGAFWLIDAGSLTVTGAVDTGTGSLRLVTTGDGHNLTINAPLSGAGVTLKSAGLINQDNTGIITANGLVGSSSGATQLTAANRIANLWGFTTSNADFALRDNDSLTVTGALNVGTGNLALTTIGAGSDLLLRNNVLAANSATLTSSADIDIFYAQNAAHNSAVTLDAFHSIVVQAPITMPDATALSLQFGHGGSLQFAGGKFAFTDVADSVTQGSLSINGSTYTLVNSISQLASDIAGNANGNYALANTYNAAADGIYTSAPVQTVFGGTFEGLGNVISNLTIKDPGAAGTMVDGLFTQTAASGMLRDFRLVNVGVILNTKSNFIGGGLVGENLGTIDNVSVSGAIAGFGIVGGLAGTNNGLITMSTFTGIVQGGGFIGGLVGSNAYGGVGPVGTGTISQSSATGKVTGLSMGGDAGGNGGIGGLAGANVGLIDSSYTNVTVSNYQSDTSAGGLVGASTGTIENSYTMGSTTSDVLFGWVGGIAGYSDFGGLIDHSYATGTVLGGDRMSVGGVAGEIQAGEINASYATGTVTGGAAGFVGGLVGDGGSLYAGVVIGSYATGAVSGGSQATIGGLAGYSSAIYNSFATGSVTGTTFARIGGLVGNNGGPISQSYATGSVTAGDNATAGGLAGYSVPSVLTDIPTVDVGTENSYALGDVTVGNNSSVGGLMGLNTADITNTYSAGKITAGSGSIVGGLVGQEQYGFVKIENCFWDISTSGIADPAQAVGQYELRNGGTDQKPVINGLTTAQIQSGLQTGFDPSIWAIGPNINGGFPYLQALLGGYAIPAPVLAAPSKQHEKPPLKQSLSLANF